VTYWALADMVRMRCRISEDEPSDVALAKLAAVIEEHITDEEERRFVEPRVAHLIGLDEGTAFARRMQRQVEPDEAVDAAAAAAMPRPARKRHNAERSE